MLVFAFVCFPPGAGSLTAALLPGVQDQVVPQGRGVVGQREPQSDLVGGAEVRDGGVGQEGRVAQRNATTTATSTAAAAETGPGYVDGCETEEKQSVGSTLGHRSAAAAAAAVHRSGRDGDTKETQQPGAHRDTCDGWN